MRRALGLAFFIFALLLLAYHSGGGFALEIIPNPQHLPILSNLRQPWLDGRYYLCAVELIVLAMSVAIVRDILGVILEIYRLAPDSGSAMRSLILFFKSNLLSALIDRWVSWLVAFDNFTFLQTHLWRYAPFQLSNTAFGWIMGLLAWELTTWVYHISMHKVRLLWCLHAQHHAPPDMNISTAWVHFFAESYYTTTIQAIMLCALGVPAYMLVIFWMFEANWNIFVHAGERMFKKGRFGWLRHIIITPSTHRIHHARNPHYIDANFCTLLTFWDRIFGTLRHLRDDLKPDYGVRRRFDTTNFVDFYFGEFICLYRDVRNTQRLKHKLLYLIKPPGWQP